MSEVSNINNHGDDVMYLVAFGPLLVTLSYYFGPLPPFLGALLLTFFSFQIGEAEPSRMLKTQRRAHEQIFSTNNIFALAYAPLVISLTVFYSF